MGMLKSYNNRDESQYTLPDLRRKDIMDQLFDTAGKAAYANHRITGLIGISGIVLVLLGIMMLRTRFRNKVFSWMFIILGVILMGYTAFQIFS